ncbi:hypothetical protein WNZ14_14480 [Hoeflea sp. AS60]|uniref:hypothetical protein n=1 Tax=Hoeflea sp. AS60 TaxID=3135780 RepID=UPI00317B19BD
MSDPRRIQVLMPQEEADRFEAYCREKGFKKSPLIVRLVREHMDQVGYQVQRGLFDTDDQGR